MTATLSLPIGRYSLREVADLVDGLAAESADAEVQARAQDLGRRAEAIAGQLANLVRLFDAGRDLHRQPPTFKMLGNGDGRPTGFRCDGCAMEWAVAAGQDATDLIPLLRQHEEAAR